jgi:hypothetical protein
MNILWVGTVVLADFEEGLAILGSNDVCRSAVRIVPRTGPYNRSSDKDVDVMWVVSCCGRRGTSGF